MKITTDIDIDVVDRDKFLSLVKHIPASIVRNDELKKHNSGVYLHNIPVDPFTGLSNIDYKEAEDRGYFKVDFLNNSLYEGIRDEAHLVQLMNQEPIWELFTEKDVVKDLAHIHSHHGTIKQMKPKSVEQLAAVLAVIRPAKRHLIGEPWPTVMKSVWIKPDDDSYYFKKAHAISYAVSIVVQLNLICEQAGWNAS